MKRSEFDNGGEAGRGKSKKAKTTTEAPTTLTLVSQNVITQMMDISQPLSTLKKLLGQRLQCKLDEHEIYLQNTATLLEDKSLLEQGISAEGVVQFSVQVISNQGIKPRLNIVDIVKPIIETVEVPMMTDDVTDEGVDDDGMKLGAGEEQVTRWIVCSNYRDEQDRLSIPYDPELWTADHTLHWLLWAAGEFAPEALEDIKMINMTGAEMCSLTKEEFLGTLPKDSGELFWTHLELLKRTVPQCGAATTGMAVGAEESVTETENGEPPTRVKSSGGSAKRPRSVSRSSSTDDKFSPGNRTGNNGQIQLWQFLLELLTDKDSLDCISWVGSNGEFRLNDPELVAQKWGERKNKPSMNYEKLSRALRYYYDGDMIAKVHGQRFVYKFVCDLKSLMGYSAAELNKLVTECRSKRGRMEEGLVAKTVTITSA